MRIPLFLNRASRCDSRLKRGISNLGTQLTNSLLGTIAFGRYRLLPNHLIVVNNGGAIIFLFVVKLGDFVRAGRLLMLKKRQVCACLRRVLTVRIVKEEILESCFGVSGRG